jgi:hypothetical protein
MNERHEDLIDEPRALTRQEFCHLERMSLSTYHKLQRAGNGPDEVKFPNMAFVRITSEARHDWHAKINSLRQTDASKLEDQRRVANAMNAGKNAEISTPCKQAGQRQSCAD